LTFEIRDDGRQFVAWKNGEYQLSRPDGEPIRLDVSTARVIPLSRPWNLSFPPNWDAPSSLDLEEVKPWSEFADKPTSHFSGSAIYRTSFSLDSLQTDDQVLIDLGRVGDIAEVRLNGQLVGAQWAAPYRFDITDQVEKGNNELEIEVTNSWHNRLAYDAGLPDRERKTWTYAAPEADAKRQLAGLAAPVQIHVGKRISLNNW